MYQSMVLVFSLEMVFSPHSFLQFNVMVNLFTKLHFSQYRFSPAENRDLALMIPSLVFNLSLSTYVDVWGLTLLSRLPLDTISFEKYYLDIMWKGYISCTGDWYGTYGNIIFRNIFWRNSRGFKCTCVVISLWLPAKNCA